MADFVREDPAPYGITEPVRRIWEKAEMPAMSSYTDIWSRRPPKGSAEWYASLIECLEGNLGFDEFPTHDRIRDRLAQGLSREAFERLRRVAGIGSEPLSAAIAVPMRTLARRKVFKADESERLLRVAAVFQHTLEALENLDAARRWFTTPKRALGGRTPFEFSDTGPGAEAVERLLGRIEHGVYT